MKNKEIFNNGRAVAALRPKFEFGYFARLNKNEHIEDYIDGIASGAYDHEKVLVIKKVTLSNEDYESFTHDFMSNHDFIAGLGGHNSTYEPDREIENFYEMTEEEQELYRLEMYRECVKVFNADGEFVFIDPQGYDYARYVGLPSIDTEAIKTAREKRIAVEKAEELAKIEKEKEFETLQEARALLKPVGPFKTSAANCAWMIKKELKKEFPAVKFEVTSDNFSMGDSVDIRYKDGPPEEAVEAFTNKYQEGHYNSMEEYYDYSSDRPDLYQAKYVHCQREKSEETIARLMSKLGITGDPYDMTPDEWTKVNEEYCQIAF